MMNNKIFYKPNGLWEQYDFMINKYFWMKEGYENAYEIRKKNIFDIQSALSKYKIKHWLQGQTLKGIVLENRLLDDHDDDFGIFTEDKNTIRTKVLSELEKLGFTVVRDTDNMISFERDYRYIDICLFRKISNDKIGYSNKVFDSYHFNDFETIIWENIQLSIPKESTDLLKKMYSKSKTPKIIQKLKGNLIDKLKRKVKQIPDYMSSKIPKILNILPENLIGIFSKIMPLFGLKIVELSKNEFLNTMIEPKNSFNWKWRARHLNLVTENGKNILVKDIVHYLSDSSTIQKIENEVEETNTKKPFHEPSNFDMRFWWEGNNYFWYCVKYQYKRDVVQYALANDYIKSGQKPLIYTANYYESLVNMTDKEIEAFLLKSPIEIRDGSVVGGKHRAFAMIGRLISGKKYIPFRAIVFNAK